MRTRASALIVAGAMAVAAGFAAPALAGTNTGGDGTFAGAYNNGSFSYSTTTVNNKSWTIKNSRLTVHGGYNWTQVFSISEKRAAGLSSGPVTISGSVTITTPYGTGTQAVTPTTLPDFDVPWAGAVDGVADPNVAGGYDPAAQVLYTTECALVYGSGIPGVNADYWI